MGCREFYGNGANPITGSGADPVPLAELNFNSRLPLSVTGFRPRYAILVLLESSFCNVRCLKSQIHQLSTGV